MRESWCGLKRACHTQCEWLPSSASAAPPNFLQFHRPTREHGSEASARHLGQSAEKPAAHAMLASKQPAGMRR